MSDIAIRVEKLGKRYRIGKKENGSNGKTPLLQKALAPFGYLASTLREPSPDEILWALRDVSFEVKRGEVVGIIGKNGAGKSTLLKILTRITEPTEGWADLHGRVGSLLEVGTGFHPELTGRENIYLSGTILGMKREEINRRLDEIVAFSGVERFLDTPVKRYSSGMYVRLAFAVAAHLEPEILLVDEVLAVGDAEFQRKALGKMRDVVGEGRTVLFVSHNMGSITELTGRCMLLKSGEIVSSGPSYRVIDEFLQESKRSSLSRDVSAIRRTVWGGDKPRWQFTHVRIVAPEDGLIANKAIEIELKYASNEPFEDIRVGIGIGNIFGTRLITCRSDDAGLKIVSRGGETGTVVVRIESPHLAPGKYTLQIGAGMAGTLYALDYLENAIEFEIGRDPSDILALEDRQNLGVRLPSQWRLYPVP